MSDTSYDPNKQPGSASVAAPSADEPSIDGDALRLAELMETIDLIRPAVQADGGELVLVDADTRSGVVEVQLQGACSSCAVSSMTLQAGIERILQDRHEWVTEVRGGVDESMDAAESASMGRGGYVPKYDY